MHDVVLVIHILITAVLVGLVLLQRSEGGALGIGGGGGGLMTARGAGDVLTRATGILAALFMLTSVFLTVLATGGSGTPSILEEIAPATADEPEQPQVPEVPITNE